MGRPYANATPHDTQSRRRLAVIRMQVPSTNAKSVLDVHCSRAMLRLGNGKLTRQVPQTSSVRLSSLASLFAPYTLAFQLIELRYSGRAMWPYSVVCNEQSCEPTDIRGRDISDPVDE